MAKMTLELLSHPDFSEGFFPLGETSDRKGVEIDGEEGEIRNIIGFDLLGEQSNFSASKERNFGEEVIQTSHCLITGNSSGLAQMNNILFRAKILGWDVRGIDVEEAYLPKYEKYGVEVATSSEGILCMLKDLLAKIDYRLAKMKEENVSTIEELKQPEKRIILLWNGAVESIESAEELKSEITQNLLLLSTRGKSGGVHIVMYAPRIDASILPGSIRDNFSSLLYCGNASTRLLDVTRLRGEEKRNCPLQNGAISIQTHGKNASGQGLNNQLDLGETLRTL